MEVVLDRVSLSLQSRSWTGQVEAESKILHSISATVERGKLLGVMGGSGSGKTSLIDVIMGRAAGSISGRVTFDGVDPAPLIPKLCAYVKQGDFLLPHLTCRETLQFAARLRLPAELSDEEREQRVEEVITELGLKDCADTRVGNEYARGLSGGEKRRVSIGVQLLTDPKLLILDEPTTGLDSFTAHNLVEYLVKLAAQGRTIICSIHQPRSDIFQLFDSIMLLARGHIVYSGPTSGVVSHFEKLGVPCPEHTNPADIILDAISVDPRTPQSEASSRQRLKSFILAWQAHSATSAEAAVVVPADTHEQVPIVFPTRASWPRQVVILTHRACLNLWRDRLTTLGYLAEMLVISVLLGIIFYHIPTDLISGIRSRVAVLYLLSSMQSYLLLIFALYILVDELAVFDRERSDHMYEAIPWVISRWLSTSVLNILLPIIFSLIVYSMVGLRTDLPGYQNFWVFVLVQVAIQHCCTAMAIFCASINRPFAKSSLLANSIYTFTVLSSGFFAQTTTIPSYISWFQYISWPHWGLRILAANEFTDNVFPCVGPIDVTSLPLNATAAAIATNTAFCKQYFDGASILANLDLPTASYTTPAAALAGMFAFLFLGGALILHFLVPSVSVSAESASLRKDIMDTDIAAESALDVEMLAVKPPAEDSQPASSAKGVSIDIVDVRVTLQTSTSWTGSNDADETDRTILRGVSAHIEGGQFLVILGGSGSGKSTLLNIMAGRADPSLHTQGEILIGGRPLAQCGATIGYVMQADYLIPTLTVRETLNYAAALRLPSTMSDVERTQRVEEVIADLGLSECANTRVGDDDERGISGGERRRTSIAIQLLSEPAVLLCDEPTSGLDSTSAYHLMRTLRRLATEKHRTVVASIHQPRSDVYSLFDDIMLLSRGELIYVGRAGDHILQYFQSLGHNCPAFFNPSDWVLDLSSVDLRHPTVEAESRARVLELAKAYQKSNVCAERTAIVNQAAAAAKQLALAPGDASSGPSASFSKAFPVLVSRSMTHFSRSPIIISARIFQTLSYALILALYFAPMSNDQRYIQNRLGLLQQYTGLLFVGMLNCLAVFINERNVFWRERADGAYETAPFFLSYLAGELPFEIVGSLVYALLVGPVVGMGHSPSQYFVTAYIVFCIITSGESFGILFCAFIQHAGFAVSLVNALLSTFTIMAGFLAFSMPAGIKTINYISLLRYTSRLNAVYEFRGQPITCLPDQITAGVCPITSGSQVLELYGFDASVSAETLDWVMSAVLVIVYRLIAFLALKYNRSRFAA